MIKNNTAVGHMIRELRPGEVISFQIPKSFFADRLDSDDLYVKVTHEMKHGRSCRLVIEAPKAVVISKS